MKKKIIHINQHVIKDNAKTGKRNPPITCKTYNSNTYAFAVKILGDSVLKYSPEKTLGCGAKAWIETKAMVILDLDANGKDSFLIG